MKTDRFTDIIRRKLESIRPEFTEKDWTRMQATLQQANLPSSDVPAAHQPFTGGVWSGQPWLLAAATVSTVVLVGFSIWQRSEINQLRQTVGQLNHREAIPHKMTPVAPAQSGQQLADRTYTVGDKKPSPNTESLPPVNPSKSVSGQTDTVYITRYVTVPSPSHSAISDDVPSTPPITGATAPQYATTNRASTPAESPRTTTSPTIHQQTTSDGIPSTPIDKNGRNSSVTPTSSANSVANEGIQTTKTPKGQYAQGDQPQRSRSSATTPADQSSSPASDRPNSAIPETKLAQATPSETNPVETNGQLLTYESITSRPLTLASPNWARVLNQRARPLRTAHPRPTVIEQAPESQPVERVATQYRLGAGGEFDARMWGAGVFSEVILNKHWTLGIGLNRATYMSGTFLSAPDFDARTQRDFRQEFARGIPPSRDIWNIDTRMVRLQIPLTLGYRVPLSKALTLSPTVGTYLNLTNTENVTFYYLEPQRGFDEIRQSGSRPVDLINSFTFGTNLEWQRNHWVAQAGPLITLPMSMPKQPGPNWEANTTIGLRARLFYQF